jgi:hypothetical protein
MPAAHTPICLDGREGMLVLSGSQGLMRVVRGESVTLSGKKKDK